MTDKWREPYPPTREDPLAMFSIGNIPLTDEQEEEFDNGFARAVQEVEDKAAPARGWPFA